MIKTEFAAPGLLKIIVSGRLKSNDFTAIAPAVDGAIKQYGAIGLLVDASHLEGWENVSAVEDHAAFVKGHQEKVERIAVIVGREWQHWLVGAVKVFLHPQIRVFEPLYEVEALQWIAEPRTPIVRTAAGEPIERVIENIADGR